MHFKSLFNHNSSILCLVFLFSAPAYAELQSQFSASNLYLYRGLDAGNGPLIAGELTYQNKYGVHTGIWAANTLARQTTVDDNNTENTSIVRSSETDFELGYAYQLGKLTTDIGVIHYHFPELYGSTWGDHGNFDETYLKLGYSKLSFSFYTNNNDGDETYSTLGYQPNDKLSFLVGTVDAGDALEKTSPGANVGLLDAQGQDDLYTHFDIAYQVNASIKVTTSQIINQGEDNNTQKDLRIAIEYQFPIDLAELSK